MGKNSLKITCIGVGAMGSAILRGLLNSTLTPPQNLTVFDVDSQKSRALNLELGIGFVESIEKAVIGKDSVVILAVKPQQVDGVLVSLAPSLTDCNLIISIAAGISTQQIIDRIGAQRRVVRAMPNAAAMVGKSSTAICRAGLADGSDIMTVMRLFESVGNVVEVDENSLNAVTALSGSGPGYLFVIMEAMTDAGVLLGLPRSISRALTVQTFIGAASMALEGKSFSDLKDLITSPGGTTITGLKIMELAGIRGTFMKAIENAATRADELSGR